MLDNTIRTLDYGTLNIAYNDEYLKSECIEVIESSDGNIYEIRLTNNGKLVAYLNNY